MKSSIEASLTAKSSLVKKSGWYFLGGFGAVEAIKDYQGQEMKDWIATLNLKTGVQSFF